VGLKEDGTVVAAGHTYPYYGQCNVDDWTDIIHVAASEYYTMGLKTDGRVVAAGKNWHGQCNVDDWTDIIQVAAGGYHTLGLKSDDTVITAGPEIELAKILLLIEASLHSPAELRVRDTLGHVTGMVGGEVRDEIPWTTFNQEDECITVLYGFGSHFFEVEGVSTGTYGLTVSMADAGFTTTFTATDIPTTDVTAITSTGAPSPRVKKVLL
jgi:alpha-tubulin suppressor-like RCC1 family protein